MMQALVSLTKADEELNRMHRSIFKRVESVASIGKSCTYGLTHISQLTL